jgi:hypothetical protein
MHILQIRHLIRAHLTSADHEHEIAASEDIRPSVSAFGEFCHIAKNVAQPPVPGLLLRLAVPFLRKENCLARLPFHLPIIKAAGRLDPRQAGRPPTSSAP